MIASEMCLAGQPMAEGERKILTRRILAAIHESDQNMSIKAPPEWQLVRFVIGKHEMRS
jgi:hypothetical protein